MSLSVELADISLRIFLNLQIILQILLSTEGNAEEDVIRNDSYI